MSGPSRLGAGGVSNQLARPSDLEDTGREWASHRRSTQGYMWGVQSAQINKAATGLRSSHVLDGMGEKIRAYPQVFPVAGTLTKIGWWLVTNMVAGQKIQFAIYDVGSNNLPGSKLFDTGDNTLLSNGYKTFSPQIRVSANTMLWLAWNFNDAFAPTPPGADNQRLVSWDPADSEGVNGYPDGLTVAQIISNNRVCHGWSKASAYSNGMPTVFPTDATVKDLTTAPDTLGDMIPAWLYFFTQD